MSVLATIGMEALRWTVPKALDWLSKNVFGGGKEDSSVASRINGQGAQQDGMKTTQIPGGGSVSQFSSYPPGLQKFLEENGDDLVKEITAKPEQYKDMSQLMQQHQQIFGDQADEFGPIASQARERFQTETIPGLAERFTSITGGGQRSGAFARQATKAGENLESSLAALQAGMGSQQRGQRLQELQLMQNNMTGRANQQQSRQNKLMNILTGGQNTVVQPAQGQEPGFLAQSAGKFGDAAVKFGVKHGPDMINWALKKSGYGGASGALGL